MKDEFKRAQQEPKRHYWHRGDGQECMHYYVKREARQRLKRNIRQLLKEHADDPVNACDEGTCDWCNRALDE